MSLNIESPCVEKQVNNDTYKCIEIKSKIDLYNKKISEYKTLIKSSSDKIKQLKKDLYC